MPENNDAFYERMAAFINLANSQLSETTEPDEINTAFMYSVARFNAWVSAVGWNNAKEMQAARQETIDYFLTEYRAMLESQMDDYIEHYDQYLGDEAEK